MTEQEENKNSKGESPDFAQLIRKVTRNEVMRILNELFAKASVMAKERNQHTIDCLELAEIQMLDEYLKDPNR